MASEAHNSDGIPPLPPGSWDSHVHVADEERFPFHASHPYRPKKADLNDLLRFESSLGIEHVCLICMSVYGDDNSSILDALTHLGGKGRAVVCIDPTTITDESLDEMHRLGVRGVRVNLKTRNEQITEPDLRDRLHIYANRLRKYGWVIQIYLMMHQISLLSKIVEELDMEVVIDHLGSPDERRAPPDQEGYQEFMDLLKRKLVYVKLSGTYRFPNLPGLDQYVQEILRIAPSQVVWASDWPHSGGVGRNPGGDRHQYQDYQQVDDAGFIRQCMQWCDWDNDLIKLLFVENPRKLWRFQDSGIPSHMEE